MIEKDLVINGRKKDLGGFTVARTIPSPKRRHVGPFVFLDHMGPMQVDSAHSMDVRPHPHIGLSTVTYLFSGRGFHRDSLGSAQVIAPGDLNWMTAGKGIVHSERTPEEDRNSSRRITLHGIQIWVALPVEYERCEPNFSHYAKSILPSLEMVPGLAGKLLIGQHGQVVSPVKTYSKTFFAEMISTEDLKTKIKIDEEEVGIFLVEGSATINGQKLDIDDIILISDPQQISLIVTKSTRLIFIGGQSFPEPRYIWWNFVSSKKELIHEAAALWERQQMGRVPEETDFIPLPKDPLP